MPLNQAFIAKLGWKILSDPNNLWVKIIRNKYLTDSTFFDYNSKSKDSFIWRKILSQRELLRKGIRWKIGDGRDILFWLDNWTCHCSLIELLGTSPTQVNINEKVSNYVLPGGKWDLEKLKNILSDNHVKIIAEIPLPTSPMTTLRCGI